MGVVFHIISTGGGAGASRATRYISEREKDPAREGPGPRPLSSEDREDLTYRKADRVLDPDTGRPEKNDLIHFSVMIEEEEFDKLGDNEKEKQKRFRAVIREGMNGMAQELNVERLTWVVGIHRNSENPHAHVVMRKDAIERGTGRERRIGRIPKDLLPHKEGHHGKQPLVSSRIGEHFLTALQGQQALHLGRDNPQVRAQRAWQQLVQQAQVRRERKLESEIRESPDRKHQFRDHRWPSNSERARIVAGWNPETTFRDDDSNQYRIMLGKRIELSMRLAFAQVWYDRAINHGETYRFNVLDQSTDDERRISELDVRRRATARATRISQGDRVMREQLINEDLDRHGDTLRQLVETRQAKVKALEKDIAGLSSKLSRSNNATGSTRHSQIEENRTPLMDRQTLTELQDQAIRLNLPEQVSELEKLRTALAQEHNSAARTDKEAGNLVAQLNVARAELLAKDSRLEKFEASVHLTTYEIHDERWSLAVIDKQIARRHDDTKLIPKRAERLDLRSLAHLNYSSTAREVAARDVDHLTYLRSEIVREIERRRQPLIADRDLSREIVDLLEGVHRGEYQNREREGKTMPDPAYDLHQIRSLEASAETLRDTILLRDVHQWERSVGRQEVDLNSEGRAVAREIMADLAVEEARERLERFLESKRVASLHLGNHRTSTLREVQSRTLTEYLAHAILDNRAQRDYRHAVKVAAHEHHGRLVSEFERATAYHHGARDLAAEARHREPAFTDKERINLEIYAERHNDESERQRYLDLARGESHRREGNVAVARGR